MKIKKANRLGFCFGANRAIEMVEKAARKRRGIETLGAVVHNERVLQKLAELGVTIVKNLDDIRGNVIVIGAHGVSPQQEAAIRLCHVDIINTTCPFVHRAQLAARKLARSGFFVVIYGEADHPEVKGILGWAEGNGLATLDARHVARLKPQPRRLGVVSQTTQMPQDFIEFNKKLMDSAFTQDFELHIIDTICHDIRERQKEAIRLARKTDLMLVIGSHTSANTNHLAQLSSQITETHLITTAEEIQPSWLENKRCISVISGASTSDETINEVLAKLETITQASE